MKKKKIIVTTDDFGVYPSIDQAIIKAVKKGKVNSIAALANYDGMNKKGKKKYNTSLENAKVFLDKTNGAAEFGCHLTLTSGRPITKASSMIDSKGYFRGIYEFKRKIKPAELREELHAQIKVFTEGNIPITHLSCHHNVLTLFPELYQEYLDVCKHYKLSIRSGNSRPKKSMNTYIRFLKFKLIDDLKRKDRKELKRFSKKVPNEFFMEFIKGKFRTTNYHDSGHYGPIPGPGLENTEKNINDRVALKHYILKKSLKKLIKSESEDSLEFILHLGKTKIQEHKYMDIDYSGIDPNYFDSRYLEYKSIMNFDFSKYPEIEMASWKKIKK